ncbi:hypothetical protein GP486_003144 [Trichoglossum hirsutum]|uniref:DJ-1/PfpI domain-containing protein n=1 Tax=Trichoglossum hirsutum TaxID=265104 RepID=A0A9P8LDM6_9PEZI|nr:hypothetical protein GP486_003144 [Trichoglossum hirsutum]
MALKVLIPLFPGFNTLDVSGPLEVLGNPAQPTPNPYSITIASDTDTTTASEGITVKSDISLDKALEKIDNYDILIQPGGSPNAVDKVIRDGGGTLFKVLSAFAALHQSEQGQRTLLSICTGALFVGSVGIFDGMEATTHFLALGELEQICADWTKIHGGKGTVVVRQRWVDGADTPSGVRVISSGAISCGLDATLYMVSEVQSKLVGLQVATMMDYAWRIV